MSTPILRLATWADMDKLIGFARCLISDLHYRPIFDEFKVRQIITNVLNGDKNKALIIIVEQDGNPLGVLGSSLCQPLFCQSQEEMAVELLLYIVPEARGYIVLKRLLEAYTYWAKLVGATYISYASYKNGIEMNRIKRLKP